jgi:hypothetical protein
VIFDGALLDAIFGALDAGEALIGGHIEQDGEIGPTAADGDLGGGADFVGGQSIATQLISQGAGDESIADDDVALSESRQNCFGHHLGSCGHVEEHFAAHVHFDVIGIEEDYADELTDAGGAGVANEQDFISIGFEGLFEEVGLGAFSAAFAAVEDDKFTWEVGHVGFADAILAWGDGGGNGGEGILSFRWGEIFFSWCFFGKVGRRIFEGVWLREEKMQTQGLAAPATPLGG